jgi:hypothetical protein
MLPFGVTFLATVPQRSEIPEVLFNYVVYLIINLQYINTIQEEESSLLLGVLTEENICGPNINIYVRF